MRKLFAILTALVMAALTACTAIGENAAGEFVIEGNRLVKYQGPGGEVTVPEGVTVLGEWAFEWSGVTKVNLPESLEEIESYCFFECLELEDVTIPAGTREISEAQAFAYCPKIQAFKVAEGNTRYVAVDGVLFTADRKVLLFYPDGKDTDAYFIPEGTERLGQAAFSKPAMLTTVVVPSTLKELELDNSFTGCIGLNAVLVSPENGRYRTYKGALYDKDNSLIYYPNGKTAASAGNDDFLPDIKDIGPWAFQHDQHLKTVKLPDGIESVGWMCFTFAESVEEITVPESVEQISGYAFADCKTLKRVTVLNPDAVFESEGKNILDDSPNAVLCGYDNSTTQAYAAKNGLKFESLGTSPADFEIKDGVLVKYKGAGGVVTVPEGVTVLGKEAFWDSKVTKVNLPESLKEIQSHCFFNCDELSEITIPAGTDTISTGQAFAYNYKLPAINVEEGNPAYTSVDGVLFTKDKKMLVFYPDGKSDEVYAIPEGTEEIGGSAFGNPAALTVIEIPSTLETLPRGGADFTGISSLKEIKVSPAHKYLHTIDGILYDGFDTLACYPSGYPVESLGKDDFFPGLTKIGAWAFQDADKLKTIELPEGITSAGWMCFTFLDAVEEIILPASLNEIPGYGFAICSNLKRLTVLNPNAVFPDDDNCILNNSKNAVLYGYTNSTTQAYAKKWNLKFEALDAAPEKDEQAEAADNAEVPEENKEQEPADNAEIPDETAAAESTETETETGDFVIKGSTLVKYNGRGGEVTVPEGVTVLGKGAFWESRVTKVNLPESLKEIQSHCFFGCVELEEITIPAATEDIHEAQAFAYNPRLQAIYVAEGNTQYVSVDGVLFTADMKTLVYYPGGKTTETYSIPEGTENLGNTAFSGPDSLISVTIPSTLGGLEKRGQFDGCSRLASIVVSPDNNDYYTFNDALYSHDGKKLIAYPNGRAAESLGKDDFPQELKEIGNWAFMDDQNLKTVEVPDGVTTVDWMSFRGMDSLESVTLPASVKSIAGAAFECCPKLEKVIVLNPNAYFEEFARGCLEYSANAVLYGYENSTTQAYAEQWGVKFESLGAAPEQAE